MQKNICITFYLYVETENGDKQVDVIKFFLIFWKEILESCCFGYTRYSILLNAVLLSGTGEGMCLRHIIVVRCCCAPTLSCVVTESVCLRHIIVLCCRCAPHCRVGLLRVCASGTSLSCVAGASPLSCGAAESACLRHIVVVRSRRAPHCCVGLLRARASGTPLFCVAAEPSHCRVGLLRVCASGTPLFCVAAVPSHYRVGLLRARASGTPLSCVAAEPSHCRVGLLRAHASGTKDTKEQQMISSYACSTLGQLPEGASLNNPA